jgi:hypothetical protein
MTTSSVVLITVIMSHNISILAHDPPSKKSFLNRACYKYGAYRDCRAFSSSLLCGILQHHHYDRGNR